MPKYTDFEDHALLEYEQAMRDLGQNPLDDEGEIEPGGFKPTIMD